MAGSIDMFPDSFIEYHSRRVYATRIINRVAANLWLENGWQVNSMEMEITETQSAEVIVTLRLVPGTAGLQVTWADTGETEEWPRLPHS
jgi:hypothetical protein